MRADWRYFIIGPTGANFTVLIYAPYLEYAFHLARLRCYDFKNADLTCYGRPA